MKTLIVIETPRELIDLAIQGKIVISRSSALGIEIENTEEGGNYTILNMHVLDVFDELIDMIAKEQLIKNESNIRWITLKDLVEKYKCFLTYEDLETLKDFIQKFRQDRDRTKQQIKERVKNDTGKGDLRI